MLFHEKAVTPSFFPAKSSAPKIICYFYRNLNVLTKVFFPPVQSYGTCSLDIPVLFELAPGLTDTHWLGLKRVKDTDCYHK